MDSPLNTAVSFQNPLGIQQPVQAAVHRKSRELPFDNPGEPYQSTHVKKTYGTKAFLCLQDFKAGIPELPGCDIQILFRERQLRFAAQQLQHETLKYKRCKAESSQGSQSFLFWLVWYSHTFLGLVLPIYQKYAYNK